jgi:hypothetical protein
MSSGTLIPYATAARLLYPEQPPPTDIAGVWRRSPPPRLTRHRNSAPRGRGTWLVSRSEVEQFAAGGGAGQRSGGRPVKEPTAYDLRRLVNAIEHQLRQAPPRPLQVGYAREVLLALKAMRDQQDELWRLRNMARLYAELVEEFNAVWNAAERVGVKIFQPMERDDWCWEQGERSGQAATAAEALVAALSSD